MRGSRKYCIPACMKTAAECPKCAFTLHLSEEELNLFFPNFACLRCGHRFPLPIDKAAYRKLRRNNFRDPMPPPRQSITDK